MKETLNPFHIAQEQLDKVAETMKLEPAIHTMLRYPMRELHVRLPVRMDDGSAKVFQGFRVQYNDARGPCKGGIRFHPDETIDTGACARCMDDLEDGTARGSVHAVREACEHTGLDPEKCTVAIQGYGNVGSFSAILAKQMLGCKVVALSDSNGGILDPGGLDPEKVLEHKQETGSVTGFPGTRPVTNAQLLELEVDILWPSAIENVITGENAGRIKAKVIAESANGPISPDADEILHRCLHRCGR